MGNKVYVAIGPADSDGELMDISDILGKIRMQKRIRFDFGMQASGQVINQLSALQETWLQVIPAFAFRLKE